MIHGRDPFQDKAMSYSSETFFLIKKGLFFLFFFLWSTNNLWCGGVFHFPDPNTGYFETFNFINMYLMYIITKMKNFIAKFPYMDIMCYDHMCYSAFFNPFSPFSFPC